MKVRILIEFEVPEAPTEDVAKDAAYEAAYNYLSFVKVSGHTSDTDTVTVHVDGFGELEVKLVQE